MGQFEDVIEEIKEDDISILLSKVEVIEDYLKNMTTSVDDVAISLKDQLKKHTKVLISHDEKIKNHEQLILSHTEELEEIKSRQDNIEVVFDDIDIGEYLKENKNNQIENILKTIEDLKQENKQSEIEREKLKGIIYQEVTDMFEKLNSRITIQMEQNFNKINEKLHQMDSRILEIENKNNLQQTGSIKKEISSFTKQLKHAEKK
jgi:hypothetical protein